VDERPRLSASEIEEELLAELQKLPTLRGTKSVRIRPYRKWGLRKSSLSAWRPSSLDCNNNTTSISALRRQPEDDEAARQAHVETNETLRKEK
jgi:hypothetical protein